LRPTTKEKHHLISNERQLVPGSSPGQAIPAKAGIQKRRLKTSWIPAFAGMTNRSRCEYDVSLALTDVHF
jgi:hypothetical protein